MSSSEFINGISLGISQFCQDNNINSQTISISNIRVDPSCTVNITGLNNSLTSFVNASCVNNVNFKDNLNNTILSVASTSNLIVSDSFVNYLSTCINNNINAQNYNIDNMYYQKCPPTIITTTNSDGSVTTTEIPGSINIGNIDNKISTTVTDNCLNNLNIILTTPPTLAPIFNPINQTGSAVTSKGVYNTGSSNNTPSPGTISPSTTNTSSSTSIIETVVIVILSLVIFFLLFLKK